MRIGEFRNMPIFGNSIVFQIEKILKFPKLSKSGNLFIFEFEKFHKFAIWKVPKIPRISN